MAGFKLDLFKGLRPRISASKLPLGEAVTALNLKLGSGDLEPIPEKSTEQAVSSGRQTRSIYKFDNAGSPLWFEWDDYVDVVRGPVKDDSIERTYYTGDTQGNGAPKLTTTELADLGNGGPYPEDWLYVGVPAPELAPTVSTSVLAETKDAEERLASNFKSDELSIDSVRWTTYPGTGTRNQTWRPTAVASGAIAFDVQVGASFRVLTVINDNKITLESHTEPGLAIRTVNSNKTTVNDWFPMDEQGSTQEADFIGWRVPVGMEATIPGHELVVGDVLVVSALNQPPEFFAAETVDFYEQDWDVEQYRDSVGNTYYWVADAQVSPSAVSGDSQWSINGSFYYDIDRSSSVISELEDRSYVYTYVNSLGEEGPPSPVSDSTPVLDGRAVLVSAMSLPPTIGYDITQMRLYRTNSTEAGTEFQFVKEFDVSRTARDEVKSADLAEIIATTTWDPPPAGMLGITTMPNGMLVGFKGKQLYFCEPYFPHAYPAEYDQAVDYNIVGLASFGNSVVVLTEGWPYIVTGSHPRNINVRPIKVNQACVSKESIATDGDKVYYASPDGIIEIGINGIRNATEALMDKSDWETYSPSNLVAEFYEGRYYGFYDFDVSVVDPVIAAEVSGTITDADESDIINGGRTVILTLQNDNWVTAGTAFDNQRQNIIDGLDATTDQTLGWNNIVRDTELVVGNVVRTSDTIVTVTLPVASGYAISVSEAIQPTIPNGALLISNIDVLTQTFTIEPDASAATLTLTGTLAGAAEADIVTGGKTAILTLTNDTWEATLTDAMKQQLIDGLKSSTNEQDGWNDTVPQLLVVGDVVRTSDLIVTITLPAVAGYSVVDNEQITAIAPHEALVLQQDVDADSVNSLGVTATGAVSALFSGTVVTGGVTEAEIVAGGDTIIITLTNDTWLAAGTGPIGSTANTQAIIDALISQTDQGAGWNATVISEIDVVDVVRTSSTVCTITLDAIAAYSIANNETVGMAIPAAVLTSGDSFNVLNTFGVTAQTPVTSILSGTITASVNEDDIVAGGKTIILTLSDDTWLAGGTGPIGSTANTQAIIDGLTAATSPTNGWNNEIRDGSLGPANVVRTSDTVCTITVPADAQYDISSVETITATIPAAALDISAVAVVASPTFTVTQVTAGTAAITGTITDSVNEADIVAGGDTIVITLTDDTWVASGAPFNAIRQDIIDGLDAAASPAAGWNNKVRDVIAETTVVRTSSTVCTITLPAIADYNVDANETITVTVPATALVLSASAIVATPTIGIAGQIEPTAVALTGTIAASVDEDDIVAGGKTIILTLTDDTWLAAGTGPIGSTANTQAIIDGLTASASPTNGWNNEIRDGSLTPSDVVRTSSTVCTITVPADAQYDITHSSTETITATVPAAALNISGDAVVADTTFTVDSVAPPATVVVLTGTITASVDEEDIVAGGKTIILTLTNDTWLAAGSGPIGSTANTQAIIDGLTAAGTPITGWNNEIRDGSLGTANVVRTSSTVCTITVPADAEYDILADETITATVPAEALDTSSIAVVASPTFGVDFLCTAGTSAIPNLDDETAVGVTARTGAKWDSDNDVYTRTATASWGTAASTWIGLCPPASYEARWRQVSGDAPSSSSGSDGVWHDMTTDVMVAYDTPADDIDWSGSFVFELRRTADSVIILTDAFTMHVLEPPRP